MHVPWHCLQDFFTPFSSPPEDDPSLEYESLTRGNRAAEHLLVVSLFSPSLSLCVPVGEGVRVGWEGGEARAHIFQQGAAGLGTPDVPAACWGAEGVGGLLPVGFVGFQPPLRGQQCLKMSISWCLLLMQPPILPPPSPLLCVR